MISQFNDFFAVHKKSSVWAYGGWDEGQRKRNGFDKGVVAGSDQNYTKSGTIQEARHSVRGHF